MDRTCHFNSLWPIRQQLPSQHLQLRNWVVNSIVIFQLRNNSSQFRSQISTRTPNFFAEHLSLPKPSPLQNQSSQSNTSSTSQSITGSSGTQHCKPLASVAAKKTFRAQAKMSMTARASAGGNAPRKSLGRKIWPVKAKAKAIRKRLAQTALLLKGLGTVKRPRRYKRGSMWQSAY